MAKGTPSNLDQLVNQELYGNNYDKIFNSYKCSECGWYGTNPDIIGTKPSYSLACPDCGTSIAFIVGRI